MSASSVTLELPEQLYKRAQRTAALLERSVEEILESTLNQALPELDEAPAEMAEDMASLPAMSDEELWKVARSRLDTNLEKSLHDLLDTQVVRPLTPEEDEKLQELRHRAGRLTLLKSQAYALLHQRGYPVPQP